jgi:kynurenine formamidase
MRAAEALESLHIPQGTQRVIFKTANTDRRLMLQQAFDTSYTAFTREGAEWLIAHTDVRLVGIDYLSVAHFADLTGPHVALLGQGVILVEGLWLGEVGPGTYGMHCLPVKLVGSDGAPARCILVSL